MSQSDAAALAPRDVIDQPTKPRLPLLYRFLAFAAVAITVAWVGFLGYGAWWLLESAFG